MQDKKRRFLEDLEDFTLTDTDCEMEYIYFIVCHVHKHNEWNNRVKIGRSKDVERRLNTLSTGSPFLLRLWYKFPVPSKKAPELERRLHRKFRWSSFNNEWFTIHPCIREFIKAHKELTECPRQKPQEKKFIRRAQASNNTHGAGLIL